MDLQTSAAATHLEVCVRESLSLHLHDNARWLGERLVALAGTEVRYMVFLGRKLRLDLVVLVSIDRVRILFTRAPHTKLRSSRKLAYMNTF